MHDALTSRRRRFAVGAACAGGRDGAGASGRLGRLLLSQDAAAVIAGSSSADADAGTRSRHRSCTAVALPSQGLTCSCSSRFAQFSAHSGDRRGGGALRHELRQPRHAVQRVRHVALAGRRLALR